MKTGDVSRRRRLADPARMRWYAHYRAVRFSRRMLRSGQRGDAGLCRSGESLPGCCPAQ
jgi:hypothetical protein